MRRPACTVHAVPYTFTRNHNNNNNDYIDDVVDAHARERRLVYRTHQTRTVFAHTKTSRTRRVDAGAQKEARHSATATLNRIGFMKCEQ